jgi:hypothetical protein
MLPANVPKQLCPTCGGALETTFLRGDDGKMDVKPPNPGDGVVCIGCGAMLQFNEDLRVELVDLSRFDPWTQARIRTMQTLVRNFQRARKTSLAHRSALVN